jgi:hypothetical protein
MSRFREFPGTFAGIIGLLALLPLYDHPLRAAGTALAVAADCALPELQGAD